MCIGEWRRLAADMPPETPVFFHLPEGTEKETDVYFDGVRVEESHYWHWRRGQCPCILVTLKKEDPFL